MTVVLINWYGVYDLNFFSSKGGKQLQVRLTIPWKHNVQIEYLALSVSECEVCFSTVENQINEMLKIS